MRRRIRVAIAGRKGRAARTGRLCLVTQDELEGNCAGWDGATVFALSNGELWQQSAFRCRQLYVSWPLVRIWRCGDFYWIEIEGAGEILPVRRLVTL